MSLTSVSKLYNAFTKYPFGKTAFSYLFSFYAPYFLTIRPSVNEMKPGFCKYAYKHVSDHFILL